MNDKVKRLFNTNAEYITYWVSRTYEEKSQIVRGIIVRNLIAAIEEEFVRLEQANLTGEDLEHYMQYIDVDEIQQLYNS